MRGSIEDKISEKNMTEKDSFFATGLFILCQECNTFLIQFISFDIYQ